MLRVPLIFCFNKNAKLWAPPHNVFVPRVGIGDPIDFKSPRRHFDPLSGFDHPPDFGSECLIQLREFKVIDFGIGITYPQRKIKA